MVSHWDVYELEVASAKEKRLTDYSFYMIGRPFYHPDGESFIFSASGPKGTNLPAEMYSQNGNEIMIKDKKQPHPRSAFKHETYAVEPTVSSDGAIAFVSRSNEFDGATGPYFYDLFIRKDGTSKRLTTERFAIIAEPFLSFDGSLAVFLASKTRNEGAALWLVKTDGTGVTYIGRPWNQENNHEIQ